MHLHGDAWKPAVNLAPFIPSEMNRLTPDARPCSASRPLGQGPFSAGGVVGLEGKGPLGDYERGPEVRTERSPGNDLLTPSPAVVLQALLSPGHGGLGGAAPRALRGDDVTSGGGPEEVVVVQQELQALCPASHPEAAGRRHAAAVPGVKSGAAAVDLGSGGRRGSLAPYEFLPVTLGQVPERW